MKTPKQIEAFLRAPRSNSKARTPIAYHGSPVPIRKFTLKFAPPGGGLWFSGDKETILHGESGAVGTEYLMTVKLSVRRPAGWDEYDRLSLAELENAGYDGVHLDDVWIVFDPKNVQVIDVKKTSQSKPRSNPKARTPKYRLTVVLNRGLRGEHTQGNDLEEIKAEARRALQRKPQSPSRPWEFRTRDDAKAYILIEEYKHKLYRTVSKWQSNDAFTGWESVA